MILTEIPKWPRTLLTVSLLNIALAFTGAVQAQLAFAKPSVDLPVASEARLALKTGEATGLLWQSTAPQVAEVFQNGFVVGLTPGQSRVTARNSATGEMAECAVTVKSARQSIINPATLKQFPDSRPFVVDGRKCYGSELNGQRASDPDEQRFTHANRVINPKPLRPDKNLEWELQPNSEVFDGAGVPMGTVPPSVKFGDRTVPASMFNFGASKVMGGRIFIYAFSVSIIPSAGLANLVDPREVKSGKVGVSAWLPLDRVVDKEELLERIGLGKSRLPALPLAATGLRVTGGDPKMYMTPKGELSIVRHWNGEGSPPVPSHYLRRPSGTINLIYSVPGFGLGGQGVDSFLVSDGLEFFPAIGAKVFKQPTYYPAKDPQAWKVSPPTMTFLYGAIKCNGSEPVYGWIAKEALAGSGG